MAVSIGLAALGCAGLAGTIAACSSGGSGACLVDTECKGDRICVDGACVSPGGTGGGSSTSSTGSTSTGNTSTSSSTGSSSTGSSSTGSSGGEAMLQCAQQGTWCWCLYNKNQIVGPPFTCDQNTYAPYPSRCCGTSDWPPGGTCHCDQIVCTGTAGACECNSKDEGGVGDIASCTGKVCCYDPSFYDRCQCSDTFTGCPAGSIQVSSCSAGTMPCKTGEHIVPLCAP